MVLVWDGEVLGYPLAVQWRWQPVYEKPRKGVPREIIACKPGEWCGVEEDLDRMILCVGGLRPTHWLPWEPGPTPDTGKAWEQ